MLENEWEISNLLLIKLYFFSSTFRFSWWFNWSFLNDVPNNLFFQFFTDFKTFVTDKFFLAVIFQIFQSPLLFKFPVTVIFQIFIVRYFSNIFGLLFFKIEMAVIFQIFSDRYFSNFEEPLTVNFTFQTKSNSKVIKCVKITTFKPMSCCVITMQDRKTFLLLHSLIMTRRHCDDKI